MEKILQEFPCTRKTPFSERFNTVLPRFLSLLESEWSHSRRFMNAEEQSLVRRAHSALGALNELQDGAP